MELKTIADVQKFLSQFDPKTLISTLVFDYDKQEITTQTMKADNFFKNDAGELVYDPEQCADMRL